MPTLRTAELRCRFELQAVHVCVRCDSDGMCDGPPRTSGWPSSPGAISARTTNLPAGEKPADTLAGAARLLKGVYADRRVDG